MLRIEKIGKSHQKKNPLLNYIVDTTVHLHPTQKNLIEKTLEHEWARMLGAPEQLQFLGQMAKYIGAKKTLDIGVFTGYSAMAIALVLPAEGRVVACDWNDDYVSIGKPFWKEAGVDNKIDLKIADAKKTLENLLANGEEGTYDFAFIDADKPNYDTYYELCMKLIRPGGIIAFDNMLWDGSVADESKSDVAITALRELNSKLAKDQRINYSLLTVGDGTGLAFKL